MQIKTAIVTGASRGIGRAIALRLIPVCGAAWDHDEAPWSRADFFVAPSECEQAVEDVESLVAPLVNMKRRALSPAAYILYELEGTVGCFRGGQGLHSKDAKRIILGARLFNGHGEGVALIHGGRWPDRFEDGCGHLPPHRGDHHTQRDDKARQDHRVDRAPHQGQHHKRL